jgi:hypothetical protein
VLHDEDQFTLCTHNVSVFHATAAGASLPSPGKDELRWRAQPLQLAAWREWFGEQLALATKATSDRGLYVGLRLDGRVRASGMGQPPWARFAVELAPLEGERRAGGGALCLPQQHRMIGTSCP